jgi:hypothetical protein
VVELVQFGGTPVRVLSYYTVGFRVEAEADARLRSYIRGEDEQTLYIKSDDPGNAWLLLMYQIRDSARWWMVRWVPLEPSSDEMSDAFFESFERTVAFRTRLRLRWFMMRGRTLARPVGPGVTRSPPSV